MPEAGSRYADGGRPGCGEPRSGVQYPPRGVRARARRDPGSVRSGPSAKTGPPETETRPLSHARVSCHGSPRARRAPAPPRPRPRGPCTAQRAAQAAGPSKTGDRPHRHAPGAGGGGRGAGGRRGRNVAPVSRVVPHDHTAYRSKVHATPTAAACWLLDLVEAFSFDTRRFILLHVAFAFP